LAFFDIIIVSVLKKKGSFMNQLEQKLEQDFGIVFSQKDLLETAFTHTSYANEHIMNVWNF